MKAKIGLLLSLIVLNSLLARAEILPPIRLWDSDAPGALGNKEQDIPTITPYITDSEKAIDSAIVICPGGAYAGLAQHEGNDYALFLNKAGITCFVLKYRLGAHGYRHPVMLQDAQRAVRLVRNRANQWKINPDKIGIMGSSAGGHLASTLLTHFDEGNPNADDPIERASCRPNFGILCYPVITMGENTHQGTKNNLLGKDPKPELIKLLSNELQVKSNTPPCFIWHTWEDKAVKVENSIEFAIALRRAGVPFDFHIYQKGPHGIGLKDKPPFENVHPWANDLLFFLKENGWCK
ncbi:MAG TPA: alpha/beta hydrolase [Verrucomicrobiota bacterium]|nr:alpha/beta hydrolase [Verrucomicrobiota bacterium]